MSSDEEKSTSPVLPKDSVQDSSVSSNPQDEYEELFRYTVVTPKFEQCVSKLPEPASEKTPADKDSDITDDASLHKIPVSPSVKQASMEQPYKKQVLPEATSLHGSREVSRTPVTELVAPDETLTQIENILDLWSGSLKVITTLTKSLDKQKERVALMRNFAIWRIQHVKAKQEEYANRIADRHFQTALMKKVWTAWRSLTQAKWKEKVARACQLRAEDVCVQLTNDYEAKIAELVANLEQSKTEILRLHNDRDEYEDTMKKAFMRGVCALNLEAMTMFQCKDSRPDPDTGSRRSDNAPSGAGRPPPSQYNPPSPPPPPAPAAALQVEGMFASHLSHAACSQTRLDSDSPVIVTSTASGPGVTSTQKLPMAKVITSAQQKPARTITARITGRVDMGPRSRATGSLAAMGIPPPVSSVIVEKHHPITQQTISQATAAKYPRTVLHSSGSTTVRPAGQVGRVLQGQTHTSVQSIKVVD
ncbi:centrosomal protein POC5 isoform X2 [Malurus melanocephalus]|uniref:centrosomal protein POC5 isoform X2 n=1 Tax=Malurus melanocephalus TaxID=175006 RepID=UPI0025466F70|nr:centrosomal protein POC5 isoform X2 [Malurus melanocephalus]